LYLAGEQVTGGLDPNFSINAWGGPTNFGALAADYLDGLVLMGEAWMLHLILPPDPRTRQKTPLGVAHIEGTRV
jgi:hypothetical protein